MNLHDWSLREYLVVWVKFQIVNNMNSDNKTHSFSLEVRERSAITNFQMSKDTQEVFLIEGFLGAINSVQLIEDVVLEIEASNGVLRIDFDKQELLDLITKTKQNCPKREQKENTVRFKFWAL